MNTKKRKASPVSFYSLNRLPSYSAERNSLDEILIVGLIIPVCYTASFGAARYAYFLESERVKRLSGYALKKN
jgi:hypothetical protein